MVAKRSANIYSISVSKRNTKMIGIMDNLKTRCKAKGLSFSFVVAEAVRCAVESKLNKSELYRDSYSKR